MSAGTPSSSGTQSMSNDELPRNMSSPPGRSTRAASGIQRYGSLQIAAPYSLTAKSKHSAGNGNSSAIAVDQREGEVVLVLEPACGGELRGGVVEADRPGAAPGQPGGDVAGAAPQLQRGAAVDVGRQQVDVHLGDLPDAPARVLAPAGLAGRDVLLGLDVPGRAVGDDVVGAVVHAVIVARRGPRRLRHAHARA